MMQNPRKGFTLLELLVAMGIIAILATVIVGMMGGYKSKGGDAGVKKNMISARNEASIYYLDAGRTYANMCANTKIRSIIHNAVRTADFTPSAAAYANGTAGTGILEACHSDATRWAVWVPLKGSTAGSPRAWCIDSTNVSKESTSALGLAANAYVCP